MQDHQIILKYFPSLCERQIEQFSKLGAAYASWNAKINVISRKDIDKLYVRHVLHSLAIAKVVVFKAGTHILDAGTGGGFPGIPLAILFPETHFHLIDSIGKKIKVVNEISNVLELKNVKTDQERVENLSGKYDFVVSRAVTQMDVFYGWVKNKIKSNSYNTIKNGILYLKGGDLSQELTSLKRQFTEHKISDYFEEDFFIEKKVVHIPM